MMHESEQVIFAPHPLSRFVPLFLWIIGVVCFTSTLLYPLSPIPFALIGILHGRKNLIIFSLLSIILISILLNGSQGILLLSYALGLAWIWSECSKLKIPLVNFLVISVGGCFTIFACTLFFISNGDIPAFINNALLAEIKQFLEAPVNQYPQFFNQEAAREYILKHPDEITARITELLPGIIGGLVVLLSWSVVAIAGSRKALINLELPPSLTQWSTPANFIWIVVVTIPLTIWGIGPFRVFGITGLCVVGSFYFLHGLSIVRYWFVTRAVSKWIRGVAYFLIFLVYPFSTAIIGLGLFDPLIHFRERIRSVNDEEEGELI